MKKRYVRDDEAAKPWPIKMLSQPATCINNVASAGSELGGELGFYSLSQYAIKSSLFSKPRPIKFPSTCLVSRNHYNPKWSWFNGGSHRRLKNVICLLEWVPDTSQLDSESKRLSRAEAGAHGVSVSDTQIQSLRATFDRYDTTKRGNLTLSQFKQLLQALEFTAGIADVDLDNDAGAHVSCKLEEGPNGIRTVRVIETSGDGKAITERNNVDERELSRLLYKLGVTSTPGAEQQSEVSITFENFCSLMNDHERYLTEVSSCRLFCCPSCPTP